MKYYLYQSKAAFIPKDISDKIKEFSEAAQEKINTLYEYDSYYDIIANFKAGRVKENNRNSNLNLLKVAKNIVQRGFPAFAPVGSFQDISIDEITAENVISSLNLFDPDYKFNPKYTLYQKSVSGEFVPAETNDTEIQYLTGLPSMLFQFMEPQKPLEEVIEFPNTDMQYFVSNPHACFANTISKIKNKFNDQRLDFSLVLPNKKCVAIELDGPQHQDPEQRTKDRARDNLLRELYWNDTIRIDNIADKRQHILVKQFFKVNYLNEYVLRGSILAPVRTSISMARIADTFLWLAINNIIKIFSSVSVNLEIETRDFKAAIEGIKYVLEILFNLQALTDKKYNIAPVYLKLVDGEKEEAYSVTHDKIIKLADDSFNTDIIIKENIERRYYDFRPHEKNNKKIVWLYSSYGQSSKYKIEYSLNMINYTVDDSKEDNLKFFLREIFRKDDFRPNQFDIIKNALNRKNTIGLLPTGSGKSLTYQLTGMLQPAPSIVICPIISLMKDQVANLKNIRISHTGTINSDIPVREKNQALYDFQSYRTMFTYISPERLLIPSFRNIVKNMVIATVVLDEAHCISQWGHDFRTSYLMIGDIINQYMPDSTVMALTGTASCNVVTDIKRELRISERLKSTSIITANSFNRSELNFYVYHLKNDVDLAAKVTNNHTISNVIDFVAQKLFNLTDTEVALDKLFEQQNGFYKNAGIIFSPYATKENCSVNDINQKLSKVLDKDIKRGTYYGDLAASEKNNNQDDFINNKICILVATKAFGMGIDKPNIRFTVHMCTPESVEAFYQEAGRAGRDRQKAVNVIIAGPKDPNMDYKSSCDHKIYDYFLNQNFPDRIKFKNTVEVFLNAQTLYNEGYENSIMQDLDLGENPRDYVQLKKDENGVYINVNVDKKNRMNYKIEYNEDSTVSFCNDKKEEQGPLFSAYSNEIFSTVEQKVLKAKNQERFIKFFGYQHTLLKKSLLDVIADNEDVGYIGLDYSSLSNPVEKIIRSLMDEFQREYPEKAFLISTDDLKTLNRYRKERLKKEKSLDDFFTFYNELRKKFLLKPLNQAAYRNLVDDAKSAANTELNNSEERMVYYLSILGIFKDIEVYYAPKFYKVTLNKITKEGLKKNIAKFIANYETRNMAVQVLHSQTFSNFLNTDENDIKNLLKNALYAVIDYSYDKIRVFREKQSENIYRCIQDYDESDPEGFSKEIYKYFESKYTDDILKNINNQNMSTPIFWMERILDESVNNPDSNLLYNLSHLRTSALKIIADYPNAFTPYFLYAFGIFKDTSLSIQTGIAYYIEGVKLIQKTNSLYSPRLMQICRLCLDTTDIRYLEEVQRTVDTDFKDDAKYLKEFKQILSEKLRSLQNVQISLW